MNPNQEQHIPPQQTINQTNQENTTTMNQTHPTSSTLNPISIDAASYTLPEKPDPKNHNTDMESLINHTTNRLASELTLSFSPEPQGHCGPNKFLAVAKYLSKKSLSKNTIRKVFKNIWKTIGDWTIDEIRPYTFRFSFQSQEDLQMVLERRPWTINGGHLAFHLWQQDAVLEDIKLSLIPFWVQAHGLPPSFDTEHCAKEMAPLIGKFLQYHDNTLRRNAFRGRSYVRLRVEVDTAVPITAGFFLEREGKSKLWVQFRYERLSQICFKCGIIGHDHQGCPEEFQVMLGSPPFPRVPMYGPWLDSLSDICTCFDSSLRARPLANSDALTGPHRTTTEHNCSFPETNQSSQRAPRDRSDGVRRNIAEEEAVVLDLLNLKNQTPANTHLRYDSSVANNSTTCTPATTQPQPTTAHLKPPASTTEGALIPQRQEVVPWNQGNSLNPPISQISDIPNIGPNQITQTILQIISPLLHSIAHPNQSNTTTWTTQKNEPNGLTPQTQKRKVSLMEIDPEQPNLKNKSKKNYKGPPATQTTTSNLGPKIPNHDKLPPPNSDWRPGELLKLVEAFKDAFAIDLTSNHSIQNHPYRSKRTLLTPRRHITRTANSTPSIEEERTTGLNHEGMSDFSSSSAEAGAAGHNLPPPPQC